MGHYLNNYQYNDIIDESDSIWYKEDEVMNYSRNNYTSPQFTSFSSRNFGDKTSYIQTPDSLKEPGCIGLANLGFTCYLNSCIQSLSHIKAFSEYFISNKYQKEINKTNPLGTSGELVESYAKLIKKLWNKKSSKGSIHPCQFKRKLDQVTTLFEGFEQHDSQEFLLYLLDALHEDLNRIQTKPIIEITDFDGKVNDLEASKISWEWHLKRNSSIIVDWFQGQLKSKLVCCDCKKVAIKFDPMMYLSLPIPIKKEVRYVNVVYARNENFDFLFEDQNSDDKNDNSKKEKDINNDNDDCKQRKNIKYTVEVPKNGTVSDLLKSLALLIGDHTNHENLLLTEVHNSHFLKYFSPSLNLSYINDNDVLFVYNLNRDGKQLSYSISDVDEYAYTSYYYASNNEEDDDKYRYLPIVFRRNETSYMHSSKSYFSIPTILLVPKSMTYSQLYRLVFHFIRPFIFSDDHFRSTDDDDDQNNDSTNSSSNNHNYTSDHHGNRNDYYSYSGYSSDFYSSSSISSYSWSSQQRKDEFNYEEDMNQLFELTLFDLFCKMQRRELRESTYDPSSLITFPRNCCLSVDWTKTFYDRYYNFTAEQDSHENHESASNEVENSDNGHDVVSIDRCIQFFTEEEKLGADNAWFCSHCKGLKPAVKKIDLFKLPPFLVIHFKRFGAEDEYYGREKIENKVTFPLTDFDLTRYQRDGDDQPPAIYDLIAVTNHSGTLTRGHYITYAKNCNDGNWYRYDDSTVTQINDSLVCTNSAYFLIYQRKDSFNWATSGDLSYQNDDLSDDDDSYHSVNSNSTHTIESDRIMAMNLRDSNDDSFLSERIYSVSDNNYTSSNYRTNEFSNLRDRYQTSTDSSSLFLLPSKQQRSDDFSYDSEIHGNLGSCNSIQDFVSRRKVESDSENEVDNWEDLEY